MVKNSFYRATPLKWDLCLRNESSPNLEVRATKRVAMGEAQPGRWFGMDGNWSGILRPGLISAAVSGSRS